MDNDKDDEDTLENINVVYSFRLHDAHVYDLFFYGRKDMYLSWQCREQDRLCDRLLISDSLMVTVCNNIFQIEESLDFEDVWQPYVYYHSDKDLYCQEQIDIDFQ